MEALAAIFYLVVIVAAGFGGGFVLARKLAGTAAVVGWIVWLCVPVAFLAVAFGLDTDPTLTAEQASYNYWTALVLTSVGVMLPWLPASLFGAALGRRARSAAAAQKGEA